MISVTILTKNSSHHLKEVLGALKDFDEVVIVDTGSCDNTLNIAKKFPNTTIFEESFCGFGPIHNKASSLAKNEWILSIDSDEVVSKEMATEIFNTKLCENCGYSFPRHNYFNDKWIKWCGWYPDRHIRLYHRGRTQFSDAQVHEEILLKPGMEEIKMKAPLRHYSYRDIADFLDKMQLYSTLFAKQYQGKKKASLWKALSHGFFTFFKSYILKRGIMGGYEGFVISLYNAHTAYYKYLKLKEANQKTPFTS